jgi:hypothetical protein
MNVSKRSPKQKMLHALIHGGFDTTDRAAAIAKLEQMQDLAIGLRPDNPLLEKLERVRARIYKHFDDI